MLRKRKRKRKITVDKEENKQIKKKRDIIIRSILRS